MMYDDYVRLRSILVSILLLFAVVGSVLNLIVLYMYGKRKEKTTTRVYILALGIVDFTACAVVIPFTIYMVSAEHSIPIDFLCKAYHFSINASTPFSALLMTAIAVDRYCGICKPLLHVMTTMRAKLIICSLGVFAACIGTVVSLMFGVYAIIETTPDEMRQSYLSNTESNDTITEVIYTGQCVWNNIYLGETFYWYYQKCFIAFYLICLVVVVALYAMLFCHLSRNKKSIQHRQILGETDIITNEDGIDYMVHRHVAVLSTENDDNVENDDSVENDDNVNHNMTEKVKGTTAVMLFVVTVVFIVTFLISFLPTFLMSIELIPYHLVVFYMYRVLQLILLFPEKCCSFLKQ